MIGLAVVLLAVAGGWGWFARPVSVEEMFPGFSWETVEWVSGAYLEPVAETFPDGHVESRTRAGDRTGTPGEDPELEGMMEALARIRLSRSVLGTLTERFGPQERQDREKDPYYISVDFQTGMGTLFLRNWDGDLILEYGGQTFRCSLGGEWESVEGIVEWIQEKA